MKMDCLLLEKNLTMSSDNVPINSLKICVIAGEASGDLIGGSLMSALKKLSNVPIVFTGIGGEKMREEGLNSLFPINDLSIMGIFELLPHIPKLLRRINETVAHINLEKPDAVVTIDSPGFALRVANRVKNSHTRLIHYVAPSVWAWNAWRAKKMSRSLDRVLTLFHFEPPYFEKHGLKSAFCGHPATETISSDSFERHNDHVLIFPGSRTAEVKKMAPVFASVYQKMKTMNPDLQARIVAFPEFKEEIEEIHVLFKDFVHSQRPNMDIDKVATGEYWPGVKAKELGLVDEIATSDDYILSHYPKREIFSVKYAIKKNVAEKLGMSAASVVERIFMKGMNKARHWF